MSDLFAGYSKQERDIAPFEFLKPWGVEPGINAEETQPLLASDEGGLEVDGEVVEDHLKGIRAVFDILRQSNHKISCLEDVDILLATLQEIGKAEMKHQ